MDDSVMISVIMGVYNDERYLTTAIESILNQSYRSFEFIICNDCSSDRSESIIKEFARKDDRIIYFKNEKNKGLAESLNECIRRAKGKYIARMDSDDISLENRFLHQIDFIEDHEDCDVVGTQAYYIDEDNHRYAKFNRPEIVILEEAVKDSKIIHPTVLMRKNKLLEVNGYTVNQNTQRAEDYDLWCKILQSGGVIHNIRDYDFLYRVNKENINKRKFKYRVQEAKLKYEWMRKTHQNKKSYLYAIKPIAVGLIPKKIYSILKKGG